MLLLAKTCEHKNADYIFLILYRTFKKIKTMLFQEDQSQ